MSEILFFLWKIALHAGSSFAFSLLCSLFSSLRITFKSHFSSFILTDTLCLKTVVGVRRAQCPWQLQGRYVSYNNTMLIFLSKCSLSLHEDRPPLSKLGRSPRQELKWLTVKCGSSHRLCLCSHDTVQQLQIRLLFFSVFSSLSHF